MEMIPGVLITLLLVGGAPVSALIAAERPDDKKAKVADRPAKPAPPPPQPVQQSAKPAQQSIQNARPAQQPIQSAQPAQPGIQAPLPAMRNTQPLNRSPQVQINRPPSDASVAQPMNTRAQPTPNAQPQPSSAAQRFNRLTNQSTNKVIRPVDHDRIMISGNRIILFTTIATDLAVASASQMLDAFPPGKVANIRATFAKYNELKKTRGEDGQLDSGSQTLASDGLKAVSELHVEDYQQGKSEVIRSAYLKMGLALGADALAASQVPAFVVSGKNAISGGASNPLDTANLAMLIGTVGVVGTAIPAQINSITAVRGIAKKIADAEGVQLGEPKGITEVDPDSLTAQIKTVETEG